MRIFIKLFILISLSGLTVLPSIGQSDMTKPMAMEKAPEEKVHVHLTDQVLISGETLWLHVLVMLEDKPTPSKIAYAEILDRRGNPVKQQMIGLKEGKGDGYLEVPEQLPSDHYLLRVYTRNSPYAENPYRISHQVLSIINPQNPPRILAESKTPIRNISFKEGENRFIQLERSSWLSSETIVMNIKPEEGPDPYCNVSVTKVFPGYFENKPYSIDDIYAPIKKGKVIVPEIYGHIIKGKLLADKVANGDLHPQIGTGPFEERSGPL
jgi:hypothetical protein